MFALSSKVNEKRYDSELYPSIGEKTAIYFFGIKLCRLVLFLSALCFNTPYTSFWSATQLSFRIDFRGDTCLPIISPLLMISESFPTSSFPPAHSLLSLVEYLRLHDNSNVKLKYPYSRSPDICVLRYMIPILADLPDNLLCDIHGFPLPLYPWPSYTFLLLPPLFFAAPNNLLPIFSISWNSTPLGMEDSSSSKTCWMIVRISRSWGSSKRM